MQKYNAGALVVYHGKSAQVSAVSADKIEIRIEGGASKSVRAKDIEFLHPGPVSSLPPRALPEPDCCEIMELMEGETFPPISGRRISFFHREFILRVLRRMA